MMSCSGVPVTVSVGGERSLSDDQCHHRFMETYSQRVMGREDILSQIEEYIAQTPSSDLQVPLLLLGGAGSGKSTIMARVAQELSHKISDGSIPPPEPDCQEKWKLFYHFAGAVPHSRRISHFLNRLKRHLDIDMGAGMCLGWETQLCSSVLSDSTCQPTILIIDAAEQMHEEDSSQLMKWLPWKLSPRVRCVLSLVNDCEHHRLLRQRQQPPIELHLTPLSLPIRQRMVEAQFEGHGFQLSASDQTRLLGKKASENPLWLCVACQRLRGCDSHEVNAQIDQLPDNLPDLMEAAVSWMEERVEGPMSAALCLLATSVSGLYPHELRSLLAIPRLLPVSPYEEKDECECSEKSGAQDKTPQCALDDPTWQSILSELQPFLHPDWDNTPLAFYHPAFHQAVCRKHLKEGIDNQASEDYEYLSNFWRQCLADYFEKCTDVNRKTEEYLHHVSGDSVRLAQCLCDWDVFHQLYNEDHSTRLLYYWRQCGGCELMIEAYTEKLAALEETDPCNDVNLCLCLERISSLFFQAGAYEQALELTRSALKLEEQELGARVERLVELNSLLADIYDEKTKLIDFVSTSQLPDVRQTINYNRKSISLRQQLPGPYHRYRLGVSLMKLAFSLESYDACGGDHDLLGCDALEEGNQHIDEALEIFSQLKDKGHYAEAMMTKGVLAKRGSKDQLKYYERAMELCLEVYGDSSLLTSRLYINIGIVYEDNRDYVHAYEYLRKWAQVNELVLGIDHPKTQRAKGVLREPRYRHVAECLKERELELRERGHSSRSLEGINQAVEALAGRSSEEDSPDHERQLAEVNEELSVAISEILQRAIGELELSEDLQVQAQNILNLVSLTRDEEGEGESGTVDTEGEGQSSDQSTASNVDSNRLPHSHGDL